MSWYGWASAKSIHPLHPCSERAQKAHGGLQFCGCDLWIVPIFLDLNGIQIFVFRRKLSNPVINPTMAVWA